GAPSRAGRRAQSSQCAQRLRSATQSRMTNIVGKLREVDSEQAHRSREALLRGQFENYIQIAAHRKPRVLAQLLFQLPGGPASVAQRNQELLRATSLAHGLENVARGGQTDLGI